MTEHEPEDDFGYPDPFALEDEPTEAVVPDDPDEEDNHTDFDAFWRKQVKKKTPPTVTILGDTVTLPRALPLQYQLEMTRQAKLPTKDQDPMRLVSILFDAQQVRKWARAGMDTDQFGVLLAWVPLKIQGSNMTLEEVAVGLEEHAAKQAAKRAAGDESGEA